VNAPASPAAVERRTTAAALLGLLTCFVALLPFFTDSGLLVRVSRHLMALVLVAAIWLDREQRAVAIAVTVLAGLEVTRQWVPLGSREAIAGSFVSLAFMLTTAGYLVFRLWTRPQVDISALIVATGLYFLVGICWGYVFSILEMSHPGSFTHVCLPTQSVAACVPELGRFERLSYFGFVTMTTLGYGDIVPATRPAEGLATAAAVSGQLFMAILIGRLVGSYLARGRDEDSGEGAVQARPTDTGER